MRLGQAWLDEKRVEPAMINRLVPKVASYSISCHAVIHRQLSPAYTFHVELECSGATGLLSGTLPMTLYVGHLFLVAEEAREECNSLRGADSRPYCARISTASSRLNWGVSATPII